MVTALVLSAGGLYAAWEVGVWKVLREHVRFDAIVGASAGAWNGWAIAGGASPEELAAEWLDPATADLMRPGLHACGILHPDALYRKTRDLHRRFQPKTPFGLVMVELPSLRPVLVRETDVTCEHLAATASIPLCFPPVRMAGRSYVDGGLVGALPLWAATEMGAEAAVGLNALPQLIFRSLHWLMGWRRPRSEIAAQVITPSERLGSLRDAMVWSRENIDRWIRLGEADGKRALPSIAP